MSFVSYAGDTASQLEREEDFFSGKREDGMGDELWPRAERLATLVENEIGEMDCSVGDGLDAIECAFAIVLARGHGYVCSEGGTSISDAEARDIIVDVELTFLKQLARNFPKVMTAETRRRLGSLDRRIKRARGIMTDSGGDA